MAQDVGEELIHMGISHGVRWLWGAVGVGGLAVFLLLAAMVGLTTRSQAPRTHSADVITLSGALSKDVAPWRSTINRAARLTGVPAPLIVAEVVVESRGRAHAGTLAGAYGLMQLEPGTMGLTNAERANPADNILAGAEYLAQLHAAFQSWREASTAYYGGAGLVAALLPRVPMPWRTAQPWLDVVPNPGANTLTLAQYANTVFRVAHQWQGVRP